eukprot:GHUV01033448.1.p1 GENE.GHUV01033448.1~~GHUV01033448.1.p1  ORF type:complete len:123 (-),score=7.39 GHUV01033448.1:92-460(-)
MVRINVVLWNSCNKSYNLNIRSLCYVNYESCLMHDPWAQLKSLMPPYCWVVPETTSVPSLLRMAAAVCLQLAQQRCLVFVLLLHIILCWHQLSTHLTPIRIEFHYCWSPIIECQIQGNRFLL